MSSGGTYVSRTYDGYFLTHFSLSLENQKLEPQRAQSFTEEQTQRKTLWHFLCGTLCPLWLCFLPHVFDHVAGKLTGLNFGCAFHHAFKIISDFLLHDGALHAVLDQIGSFVPAQVTEHHHAREND